MEVGHRGLLRRVSTFFRDKRASSGTREDEIVAQVTTVKEEDPRILRRFKNWIYSGKIISETETHKSSPLSDVIAVYIFGERQGILRLLNTCVDTVSEKRNEGALLPGQAEINNFIPDL